MAKMKDITMESVCSFADNGSVIRTRVIKDSMEVLRLDDTVLDDRPPVTQAIWPVELRYETIPELMELAYRRFDSYGWKEGEIVSGQWHNRRPGFDLCRFSEFESGKTRILERISSQDDYVIIDTPQAQVSFFAYGEDNDTQNFKKLKSNGVEEMHLFGKVNLGDLLADLLVASKRIEDHERGDYKLVLSRLYGAYAKP